MAHECASCGRKTIFFIWSTSRVFPAERLIKSKADYIRYKVIGVPFCMRCYRRLKNESAAK